MFQGLIKLFRNTGVVVSTEPVTSTIRDKEKEIMPKQNVVESAKQDYDTAIQLKNEAWKKRYATDPEFREKEKARSRASHRKRKESRYKKEYYERNKEKILKAAKERHAKKKLTKTTTVTPTKKDTKSRSTYDRNYYIKTKERKAAMEKSNKLINDTLFLIKLAKDKVDKDGGILVTKALLESVIELMEGHKQEK